MTKYMPASKRLWTALFLFVAVSSGAAFCEEGVENTASEKPPYPWPSSRRFGEPQSWQPPGDRFSQKEARRAVIAPFATSLEPSDRSFGDIPTDVHIDGFVALRLPPAREDHRRPASIPAEVSIVRVGPRREKADEIMEPVIKTFLLLTSRGQTLWIKELGQTPASTFADHDQLSRVFTQFGNSPFVLLFCNSGGATRNFSYELYRVTPSRLEKVWSDDLGDGYSYSTQQWFSWSNFNFSALRLGQANGFTVYTTSGIRRTMEPGDEKDLKPKYTKRVYRWNAVLKTFVKVNEGG